MTVLTVLLCIFSLTVYIITVAEILTLRLLNFSMQSVQNLGLAVISIVAGLIVDTSGYMMLEMFYMIWLCSKFHTLFLVFHYLCKYVQYVHTNEFPSKFTLTVVQCFLIEMHE